MAKRSKRKAYSREQGRWRTGFKVGDEPFEFVQESFGERAGKLLKTAGNTKLTKNMRAGAGKTLTKLIFDYKKMLSDNKKDAPKNLKAGSAIETKNKIKLISIEIEEKRVKIIEELFRGTKKTDPEIKTIIKEITQLEASKETLSKQL